MTVCDSCQNLFIPMHDDEKFCRNCKSQNNASGEMLATPPTNGMTFTDIYLVNEGLNLLMPKMNNGEGATKPQQTGGSDFYIPSVDQNSFNTDAVNSTSVVTDQPLNGVDVFTPKAADNFVITEQPMPSHELTLNGTDNDGFCADVDCCDCDGDCGCCDGCDGCEGFDCDVCDCGGCDCGNCDCGDCDCSGCIIS